MDGIAMKKHTKTPQYSAQYRTTRKERAITESIMGALVGDAYGVPYEFKIRPTTSRVMVGGGSHGQPAGTWSDDGAMLLATLDTLATHNHPVYADMARNFVAWRSRGEYAAAGVVFDIGGATSQAIRKLASGKNPTQCGGRHEHSQGNGSLMRILPLSLWAANLDEWSRWHYAERVSSLTHAHPHCVVACALYGEIVHHMLQSDTTASVALRYVQEMQPDNVRQYLGGTLGPFKRFLSREFIRTPAQEISGSGWVVDCLEAAVWAAARANSYETGIRAAVELGRDTDTTACVAGGLLGLQFSKYVGRGIPKAWSDTMRERRHLLAEACRFAGVVYYGRI